LLARSRPEVYLDGGCEAVERGTPVVSSRLALAVCLALVPLPKDRRSLILFPVRS
jgi:hypothetical protein